MQRSESVSGIYNVSRRKICIPFTTHQIDKYMGNIRMNEQANKKTKSNYLIKVLQGDEQFLPNPLGN